MHSAEGWLPHLEYEQSKLTRKRHRYASQDALDALRKKNEDGLLRLDDFFDHVGRDVLTKAAKQGKAEPRLYDLAFPHTMDSDPTLSDYNPVVTPLKS